jgi:hypothetical protein
MLTTSVIKVRLISYMNRVEKYGLERIKVHACGLYFTF